MTLEGIWPPCPKHPDNVIKTIALYPESGETREEAYVRWCLNGGRNPWCYGELSECRIPAPMMLRKLTTEVV